MRRVVLFCLFALACSGRREFPDPEDTGADSKTPDADDAALDSAPPDTTPGMDTAPQDTRPPDTVPQDTTPQDTALDTSPADSAVGDTTESDSAAPDGAVPDGAPGDGMTPGDTGPSGDGGADAAPDAEARCRRDMDCAAVPGRALCDLLTGRCVGCLTTADSCPRGSFCDGAMGLCAPGCRSAVDCMATPMRPYCDVVMHQCGECMMDSHCALGRVCRDRRCVAGCGPGRACPSGETCCGTACLNTATDPLHCGSCTTVCPSIRGRPTCTAGVCSLACDRPYGDCDGSVLNGCETDLDTSLTHCGMCGRACNPPNAIGLCGTGACAILACVRGFRDCDGNAANGCEANFDNDRNNCGRCGNVCPTGRSCVGGVCTALVTGYTVGPIPTMLYNACTAPGRSLVSLSTVSPSSYQAAIPLPFAFRFWNVTYSLIAVSASGYIMFGASPMNPAAVGTYMLPNREAPSPAAFVSGRTMYARGSVCTATYDTAPARKFVVYWSSLSTSSFSLANEMKAEVILNEGTQTIEFLYERAIDSSSSITTAAIGLHDESGTRASVLTTTTSPTLMAGLHIRFSPMP